VIKFVSDLRQIGSPGTLVSSTNKTDCHDITEILLKVVLNTINLNHYPLLHVVTKTIFLYCRFVSEPLVYQKMANFFHFVAYSVLDGNQMKKYDAHLSRNFFVYISVKLFY
jgi:hypothetical protein